MNYDAIVIGAGLTGLSLAFFMKRKGLNILVLEKESRVGGAIRSHAENGFVYEEGPNTGVIGNPDTVELFQYLGLDTEIANSDAEKRLILKDNKWYPLPAGAISFLRTPLFSFSDKFGIAFEPFRKKGTNPDESVGSLAARRIGQSFVDYAVNPFISGIYAGDPNKLVTRYALPKLYNLEQQYGSFIGGAFKKRKEPKTEREKKITRKVFSTSGGLGTLIDTLVDKIGDQFLICEATDIQIHKKNTSYQIQYTHKGKALTCSANAVISTVGSYELPKLLPFVSQHDMDSLTDLNYAKVIQVAVGVDRKSINDKYISFGGLIPQKEKRQILGVLLPSFCFNNRAPDGYATLAIYMGGMQHPEFVDLPDESLEGIVQDELDELFQIPRSAIQFIKIFRHHYAIPQYEKSSGKRFETITRLEQEHKGLYIAGNIRNGIGMADRIKQAYDIAATIS
ncbi:MAG: protoporphyrinogen oxidase [Bacteroidota bacterium]|jgi:oxygen-dependent protoporphyrinogen oxidase